ncbi:cytochrome b5 [Aphomia sociella]
MTKQISLAEVKKHNNKNSLWIVIHNDVYDVTSYLGEHPGGEDTLLEVAGHDGTQNFEDVGHSEDARIVMKKFKIGTLPPGEQTASANINCSNKLKWAIVALAGAVVIGIVLRKYMG